MRLVVFINQGVRFRKVAGLFTESIGALDVPVSHSVNRFSVVEDFLPGVLVVQPDVALERCLKIYGAKKI